HPGSLRRIAALRSVCFGSRISFRPNGKAIRTRADLAFRDKSRWSKCLDYQDIKIAQVVELGCVACTVLTCPDLVRFRSACIAATLRTVSYTQIAVSACYASIAYDSGAPCRASVRLQRLSLSRRLWERSS